MQIADVKDVDLCQDKFRQVQAILDHFWKRWMTEYVPNLTERKKWTIERKNVEVGDLVLVIEPTTPRGQWRLLVVFLK